MVVPAVGRFKKGESRPENAGRRSGTPNRTTSLLKHAILNATAAVGFLKRDGKKGWKAGDGGLDGYLQWLAIHEPKSHAMLLGRVLPLQITGDGGGPVRVITDTMSASAAASAYAEALKVAGPPAMIDITPTAEEGMVTVKGSLPRVIPGRVHKVLASR